MSAAWHSNYVLDHKSTVYMSMYDVLSNIISEQELWNGDHSLQPLHIQEQALVQAWMQLRCMVKFDKPNKMSPYKSKTPASCNLWIGRLGFTIKISVYISLYCSCFSPEVTVQFTIRASRHFMALSKVGMNDYAIDCKPEYNYFTRSILKHAHFEDEIIFPALSCPLIWGWRVCNCFWCR